jgi:hypothetical protein
MALDGVALAWNCRSALAWDGSARNVAVHNVIEASAWRSDSLFFLSWRESGYGRTVGRSASAYANQRLAFGTGLPQNNDGAEGLTVNTSHQIGVPRAIFLPKLSNLNF